MAIKPVDEIPQNIASKRASYREQIRKDLREAIENNILKFEMEGDYNFKYLANYVREERRHILRRTFAAMKKEIKEEYSLSHFYGDLIDEYRFADRYVTVVNHKEPDRNHVYIEITPSVLEEARKHFQNMAEEERLEEYIEKSFYPNGVHKDLEYRQVQAIIKWYREKHTAHKEPIDTKLMEQLHEKARSEVKERNHYR